MQMNALLESLLTDNPDVVDLATLFPPTFSVRDRTMLLQESEAFQQACSAGGIVPSDSYLIPAAALASCEQLAERHGSSAARQLPVGQLPATDALEGEHSRKCRFLPVDLCTFCFLHHGPCCCTSISDSFHPILSVRLL